MSDRLARDTAASTGNHTGAAIVVWRGRALPCRLQRVAFEITGFDVDPVMRVAKLSLADSALHAPAAGFGETEFYPDFVDKAAVLVVRLARNHALPDGNNRVAWIALRLFVEVNLPHSNRGAKRALAALTDDLSAQYRVHCSRSPRSLGDRRINS